jgi:hypothetical protein
MSLDEELQNALQTLQNNFPQYVFSGLEKDFAALFYYKYKREKKEYVTYRRSIYLEDHYKGFDLLCGFFDKYLQIQNFISVNIKIDGRYYGFELTKDKRTGKYSRGIKTITRFCANKENISFHFMIRSFYDIGEDFFDALKDYLYTAKKQLDKKTFKCLDEMINSNDFRESTNLIQSNLYARIKAEYMF